MLNTIVEYLLANPAVLVAVAAVIAAGVSTLRATGDLRQGLLSLMLRAEKALAKGELGPITGDQLMELVVATAMQRVVPLLPFWLRPFITEALVWGIAGEVYARAKDYLDDGRLNGSAGAGG